MVLLLLGKPSAEKPDGLFLAFPFEKRALPIHSHIHFQLKLFLGSLRSFRRTCLQGYSGDGVNYLGIILSGA